MKDENAKMVINGEEWVNATLVLAEVGYTMGGQTGGIGVIIKRAGVRSVSMPYGRGERHFLSPAEAEKLRVWASPRVRGPKSEAPTATREVVHGPSQDLFTCAPGVDAEAFARLESKVDRLLEIWAAA